MAAENERAADHLLPRIYDGLLKLARNRMARYGPCDLLNPAELVHEAYLRAVRGAPAGFEDCSHLYFVIRRAMGDLIVEDIRRRATGKRGGGSRDVELDGVEIAVEPVGKEYLDLQRALRRLARHRPECARVVSLRYFGGLTHPEIAAVLQLSRATVERRWNDARSWLRRELAEMNVRGFAGESQLMD